MLNRSQMLLIGLHVLLQYIIDLCRRKHSGIVQSSCDSAASCLLHCVCVSMHWGVSIHRRPRPCGAVPRRVDVSRPQKLLAHSSSMSQRLGFEACFCYCVSFRRSARPCAAVRAHAPQFTSMRFSARPCVF